MNVIRKLIALFHGHSRQQPLPDVIRKVAQDDYGTITTAEQMRADLEECLALRDFVRTNYGNATYGKYCHALTCLVDLIRSKEKLETQQAAERAARERLDAAYAAQQTQSVLQN